MTALRMGVPMKLERIAGKCLVKDRERRYQHTDELLLDLETLREKLKSGKSAVLRTGVASGTLAGPEERAGQAESLSLPHPLAGRKVELLDLNTGERREMARGARLFCRESSACRLR